MTQPPSSLDSSKQSVFNMIEQQIRPCGVLDQKVLDLFYAIRREDFVFTPYWALAYSDTSIPLYQDQHMLEPKLQAHMIQSMQPKRDDKILVIGAGLGFVPALLSQRCESVVAYEINNELLVQAKKNLHKYAIKNVSLIHQDSSKVSHFGLFNKIVICGSLMRLPDIFLHSLQEGGKLVYIHCEDLSKAMMNVKLIDRLTENHIKEQTLVQTRVEILLNYPAEMEFVL